MLLATGEVPLSVLLNSLNVSSFWFGADFHFVRDQRAVAPPPEPGSTLPVTCYRIQSGCSSLPAKTTSDISQACQLLDPDGTCLNHPSQAGCTGQSLQRLLGGGGGVRRGGAVGVYRARATEARMLCGTRLCCGSTSAQPQGMDVTTVSATT